METVPYIARYERGFSRALSKENPAQSAQVIVTIQHPHLLGTLRVPHCGRSEVLRTLSAPWILKNRPVSKLPVLIL